MRKASREEIFEALMARASRVSWGEKNTTFQIKSREVKHYKDCRIQPACYQAEPREISRQKSNVGYIRVFEANWIIYHKPTAGGGSTINNLILDAVEEALAPIRGEDGWEDERTTLDGLVYHCFVEGEIFKNPGDDGQAMMIVPIKLLVP